MADCDSSTLPETKICTRCEAALPITDFSTDKRYKGGISSWCRNCRREYAKEWRWKNIEKERERHRRCYANNPEKRRAAIRKSYVKHAEKRREERRKYRMENLEREKEYSRNYSKQNPLKGREGKQRIRAQRKGLRFIKVDYAAILERDGYVCHICEGAVEPDDVHFDHVISLAKGGSHSPDNIKVAHSSCNYLKNMKTVAEVRKQLSEMTKEGYVCNEAKPQEKR